MIAGTDRARRLLLGLAAVAGMRPALGRGDPAAEIVPLWPQPPSLPDGTVPRERLADGTRPGDRLLAGIARPRLILRRPERPNGHAVLLIPGGGYRILALDNEGYAPAERLAATGYLAAVLVYRLPGEAWVPRATAPLADAQRAVRLLRAGAGTPGSRPHAVAAIGFSAGGHLAGLLATAEAAPAVVGDAADREAARPDLAGLIYPVVSLAAPFAHEGSRITLLGDDASPALRARFSLERRVTAATPPVFLAHAADDRVVPVANSLALHAALLDGGRPAELHVFAEGGHGFGVHLPAARPAAHWPELFVRFAERQLAGAVAP